MKDESPVRSATDLPAGTRVAKTGKGKKGKGKKGRRRSGDDDEARQAAQDERVREAMADEIADFASVSGLDSELEGAVLDELLMLRNASKLVREDMREDRISRFEGRAEIRALRDDSDARMVDLLGDEIARVLKERLHSERSARRDAHGKE